MGDEADDEGVVDLRPNTLLPLPLMTGLQAAIADLARQGEPGRLFDYAPHRGSALHREAGVAWLRRVGLQATADEVLVTSGAQHAMAATLATLTEPGDAVLVEEVTYAGMKSLANLLRLRLAPVALDGEGVVPEALEATCEESSARVLYCMPTLQNPTSAVMSEARRRTVAELLNARGVALVEDDSYGFLFPEPPRLSAFCERSFYITGTSKSLLPALRVGFLRAPADAADRVERAIAATTYMGSPFFGELVAGWIADGTADRIVGWKRAEARARQTMARQALSEWGYAAHVASPHGWLKLPGRWTARDFAARSAERGVRVLPADVFTAQREGAAAAVRICLGPAHRRAALQRGLAALAEVLKAGPEPVEVVV